MEDEGGKEKIIRVDSNLVKVEKMSFMMHKLENELKAERQKRKEERKTEQQKLKAEQQKRIDLEKKYQEILDKSKKDV